jgi:hypothetical protein
MSATTAPARRQLFRSEEPEWLVWALVIVLLAVGLIARTIVMGRTQTVSHANIALAVPANWTVMATDNSAEILRVSEPMETSLFPAHVTVNQLPLADLTDDPAITLGDLALKWTNRQIRDRLSYRVLSIESAKVKTQDAVKVNFVFVTEPPFATPNSIPIVAEGQDVLLKQGDNLTIATFLADSDAFEDAKQVWDRILNSLELR